MEKILIVGATGHTGKRIIRILKNSEIYQPIAMVRKEEQRSFFEDSGVRTILGDLEHNLEHTLIGINRIIFVAGSGSATGTDKTIAVDQDGAIRLIDAAKKATIQKIVMLSTMGTENAESNSTMSSYLVAKKKADDYLIDSGVPFTIVRPGNLTHNLGTSKVMAAPQLNQTGSISRDDLAAVLVRCLEDNKASNATFELLEGQSPIEVVLEKLTT